jgi:DNA-nicking Smr family endonuclease
MAKLHELKALLATAPKPQAAKRAPKSAAARALARSKHADGDIDLREAFADVQPLVRGNRATLPREGPPSVPAQRLADEAAALAASRHGVERALAHWDVGQELEAEQTFLRKGLGGDVLVRLRRGHWSVQGELDLHRLTRDEARDAVTDFLNDARGHGWRCVRIVHGKGLSSANREPVLKGKVRRWLAQRDEVLAYCEAPRHAGGAGAVLVLLKASTA